MLLFASFWYFLICCFSFSIFAIPKMSYSSQVGCRNLSLILQKIIADWQMLKLLGSFFVSTFRMHWFSFLFTFLIEFVFSLIFKMSYPSQVGCRNSSIILQKIIADWQMLKAFGKLFCKYFQNALVCFSFYFSNWLFSLIFKMKYSSQVGCQNPSIILQKTIADWQTLKLLGSFFVSTFRMFWFVFPFSNLLCFFIFYF